MSVSLTERYRNKKITANELEEKIGAQQNKKKAIMCHGIFDVVHPGHVRHLLYAKSKAEYLICSLTADKHVSKGTYRPHVPQDLRAANLAALEMVDFVVIDMNDSPLENIKIIKPDYFAKGFEYTSKGLPPKTQAEAKVVEGYGGEMIFTPGDIVYSSSALINLAPPTIQYEKLQLVMEQNNVSFDDLRATIGAMAGQNVHVVGDTIVDSYSQCAMIGGQTKTPTMSVLFENKEDFVGGAAIVAKHLCSAGANVTFTTVLGDDGYKDFVLEDLEQAGVSTNGIIDSIRPTVNKNAFVVGGYRLLKVDTIDNRSISEQILKEMTDAVSGKKTDAVVYSDFRHGIFNRRTIPTFIDALPKGIYKVADSQVASRWGNVTEFHGFDLITPNEREVRFALADQDSGIRPIASQVYDKAACKLLMMKLGERGMLVCRSPDHESRDSFYVIDTFVDNLVDAVGAGDALLAYSTLAMLVSKNDFHASILGAMAAACECEHHGNAPITPDALYQKIDAVERRMNYG